MWLKIIVLIVALSFNASDAWADDIISASIPDASVVGRGTLSFVFLDIYEATLYAPGGQWHPHTPTALSVKYHLAVNGKDIAERSVEEMRKQGFADEVKLARWNEQMQSIIPDVKNGTVLTAIYMPGQQLSFYKDNARIGTINDDEFGKLFLDIWLSEKTSQPDLRRALLGIQ